MAQGRTEGKLRGFEVLMGDRGLGVGNLGIVQVDMDRSLRMKMCEVVKSTSDGKRGGGRGWSGVSMELRACRDLQLIDWLLG